jgi:hypothetical protein
MGFAGRTLLPGIFGAVRLDVQAWYVHLQIDADGLDN